jgi:CHASE1-domain containing sensor protein
LDAGATKATEPRDGADVQPRRFGNLRSSLPALLVLIVSLSATVMTWYVLKSQTEINGATNFADDARDIAQTIRVGMQGYEETLHAVAALFAMMLWQLRSSSLSVRRRDARSVTT